MLAQWLADGRLARTGRAGAYRVGDAVDAAVEARRAGRVGGPAEARAASPTAGLAEDVAQVLARARAEDRDEAKRSVGALHARVRDVCRPTRSLSRARGGTP